MEIPNSMSTAVIFMVYLLSFLRIFFPIDPDDPAMSIDLFSYFKKSILGLIIVLLNILLKISMVIIFLDKLLQISWLTTLLYKIIKSKITIYNKLNSSKYIYIFFYI